MRNPRHGMLRTVAAVVVAAVALAVPSSVAAADPTTPSATTVAKAKAKAVAVAQQVGVMQAQLAAAQARLQSLGQAVDAAAEAYNGAMYRLQQAQAAADAAERAAGSARAQFESARRDVGRLASAAYRGQSMSLSVGALMTATSPDGLVDAVSTLGVMADRQTAVLDRMKAAQVVAGVLDRQAGDALAAVSKAAAAAAAAKAAVQAKVKQQQTQVAAINTQVTSLTRALAAARAHSRQLTRAREAGLARAAAAARRAAAARGHSHQPGGGGTDTASHPGSGPHGTAAGAARAIAYARDQLGKPYEWAATGPATFDCSGLTMMAWDAGGVSLPHWSVAQWEVSTPVSRGQARPGDLVFYAYDLGDYTTIHHVALYLGGGQMIEAPFTGADVRISSVDRPDLFGFARP